MFNLDAFLAVIALCVHMFNLDVAPLRVHMFNLEVESLRVHTFKLVPVGAVAPRARVGVRPGLSLTGCRKENWWPESDYAESQTRFHLDSRSLGDHRSATAGQTTGHRSRSRPVTVPVTGHFLVTVTGHGLRGTTRDPLVTHLTKRARPRALLPSHQCTGLTGRGSGAGRVPGVSAAPRARGRQLPPFLLFSLVGSGGAFCSSRCELLAHTAYPTPAGCGKSAGIPVKGAPLHTAAVTVAGIPLQPPPYTVANTAANTAARRCKKKTLHTVMHRCTPLCIVAATLQTPSRTVKSAGVLRQLHRISHATPRRALPPPP
eukprot:gene5362-biopygen7179